MLHFLATQDDSSWLIWFAVFFPLIMLGGFMGGGRY